MRTSCRVWYRTTWSGRSGPRGRDKRSIPPHSPGRPSGRGERTREPAFAGSAHRVARGARPRATCTWRGRGSGRAAISERHGVVSVPVVRSFAIPLRAGHTRRRVPDGWWAALPNGREVRQEGLCRRGRLFCVASTRISGPIPGPSRAHRHSASRGKGRVRTAGTARRVQGAPQRDRGTHAVLEAWLDDEYLPARVGRSCRLRARDPRRHGSLPEKRDRIEHAFNEFVEVVKVRARPSIVRLSTRGLHVRRRKPRPDGARSSGFSQGRGRGACRGIICSISDVAHEGPPCSFQPRLPRMWSKLKVRRRLSRPRSKKTTIPISFEDRMILPCRRSGDGHAS
jgi:hypothetical protein